MSRDASQISADRWLWLSEPCPSCRPSSSAATVPQQRGGVYAPQTGEAVLDCQGGFWLVQEVEAVGPETVDHDGKEPFAV